MSVESRLRLAFGGMHPDRSRSLIERFGSADAVVRRIEGGALRVSDRVRAAAAAGESRQPELLL